MSDQYSPSSNKKKQNWLLIGGALGTIGFLSVIIMGTGNKTQGTPVAQNKAAPLAIDATVSNNISDAEVYKNSTQQSITDAQNQINDLQSKFQALQLAESNHSQALTTQMSQQFAKINSQLDDMKKGPTQPTLGNSDGLPPAMGKSVGLPGLGAESPAEEEPVIQSVTIGSGSNESSGAGTSNNASLSSQIKNAQSYLPPSFVKAKLITSITAPCGGTAQDNPFPIMLNVVDSAQLANGFRMKLKGCMLLASGYGDVASERAYFRLERITCTTKKGEVINMKAEGFIAGEDGKAGLRGRLVSKAGSKVALALLSGTVGGLAQAFAQTATTLQQTPIGPTEIVTPSQSLGYAGATGVSSGFQQLSQYYINMAEKTFPVIEINDQRNVTAIFTNGMEFPVNMNTERNGTNSLPIAVN